MVRVLVYRQMSSCCSLMRREGEKERGREEAAAGRWGGQRGREEREKEKVSSFLEGRKDCVLP